MAIEDGKYIGVGFLPAAEAEAVHAEIGWMLGHTMVHPEGTLIPGVSDALLEEIDDSFKANNLKVNVGRAMVTLVMGAKERRIRIKYRRRDPTRSKLVDNGTLSSEEIAYAKSYFDTRVAIKLGRGIYAAEPEVLAVRQGRLERGLEQMGRVDIVRAMSSSAFDNLPGIRRSNK